MYSLLLIYLFSNVHSRTKKSDNTTDRFNKTIINYTKRIGVRQLDSMKIQNKKIILIIIPT